jgi:beta-lactam-binding protein with PASTA domain
MVHRDLKPQNIMLTETGVVKITDFGIAKIFTAEGVTQEGEVLGSVSYLSPEQAQAKEVGLSTDIYALGIIMFEMLTGNLPFQAENAVATVLKQVQEPPPDPRSLNPDIPENLARIILKCLAKEPAERFSSAELLLQALAQHNYDEGADLEPTLIAPKESLLPNQRAKPSFNFKALGWASLIVFILIILSFLLKPFFIKIEAPSVTGKNLQEAKSLVEGVGLRLQVIKESFSTTIPAGIIILQRPAAGEHLRQNGTISVIVSKGIETVELPNLEGMAKEKAAETLNGLGLQMLIEQEIYSEKLPSGIVITQNPSPGSRITPGSVVKLILSAGVGFDLVPDLRGLKLEEAQLILKYTKFKLKILKMQPSALYDKGIIMQQEPAPGNQTLKNLDIKVVLSRGLEGLKVPELEGKNLNEALNLAKTNGFELAVQSQEQSPDAQIIKQEPEADDPASGKIIKVWCEKSIVVPNLVGKKLEDALNTLKQMGIAAGEQKFQVVTNGTPEGIILEQNPSEGVEISSNGKVDLVVSKKEK